VQHRPQDQRPVCPHRQRRRQRPARGTPSDVRMDSFISIALLP
jgi:hypothetical protein